MILPKYFELYKHQTIDINTYRAMDIPVENIRFTERTGKWSMIDTLTGTTSGVKIANIGLFALFENDFYGDETDYVLAYFDWYSGANEWVEIGGTYDDLLTALVDYEVIDYNYLENN